MRQDYIIRDEEGKAIIYYSMNENGELVAWWDDTTRQVKWIKGCTD